jgi:hypothetical protein
MYLPARIGNLAAGLADCWKQCQSNVTSGARVVWDQSQTREVGCAPFKLITSLMLTAYDNDGEGRVLRASSGRARGDV